MFATALSKTQNNMLLKREVRLKSTTGMQLVQKWIGISGSVEKVESERRDFNERVESIATRSRRRRSQAGRYLTAWHIDPVTKVTWLQYVSVTAVRSFRDTQNKAVFPRFKYLISVPAQRWEGFLCSVVVLWEYKCVRSFLFDSRTSSEILSKYLKRFHRFKKTSHLNWYTQKQLFFK